MKKELEAEGIRVIADDRDSLSPGRKFNEWEIKGVPLRIEIGPKDLKNSEVTFVRRVDKLKKKIKFENVKNSTISELENIHETMLVNAKKKMNERIVEAKDWNTFMKELNKKQIIKTPWCKENECEDNVKQKSKI